MKKKLKAFTLAEVLITLAIVGVVAALTMPNLIANYQKKEVVTRLKKAYSVLNQVIIASVKDNGDMINWDYSTTDGNGMNYVGTYFAPYLQKIKYYGRSNELIYSSKDPYTKLNGTKYDYSILGNSGSTRSGFILADGILVHFQYGYYSPSSNGMVYQEPTVIIDTNGIKNPNIIGKDVFIFKIEVLNNRIIPSGFNATAKEISSSCSKKGGGEYCAAKIILDGWQMKDDYPW